MFRSTDLSKIQVCNQFTCIEGDNSEAFTWSEVATKHLAFLQSGPLYIFEWTGDKWTRLNFGIIEVATCNIVGPPIIGRTVERALFFS
jgi:hypothetical protein